MLGCLEVLGNGPMLEKVAVGGGLPTVKSGVGFRGAGLSDTGRGSGMGNGDGEGEGWGRRSGLPFLPSGLSRKVDRWRGGIPGMSGRVTGIQRPRSTEGCVSGQVQVRLRRVGGQQGSLDQGLLPPIVVNTPVKRLFIANSRSDSQPKIRQCFLAHAENVRADSEVKYCSLKQ